MKQTSKGRSKKLIDGQAMSAGSILAKISNGNLLAKRPVTQVRKLLEQFVVERL
jgi:hypothetical protein